MKMLLKAPLSPYSGWGQDGIGLARSIAAAGVDLRLQPLEVVPPLPADVANQLTLELDPPFDLLVAHVAADRSRLTASERDASRKRVLWSMWEWDSFANHPDVDAIGKSLAGYHAVVAYDRVSQCALQKLMPPGQTLLLVQGGFESAPWPYMQRNWRPPIRFFMSGHMSPRKNAALAIAAFNRLQQRHGPDGFQAELHIKNVDRDNPFMWPHSSGSDEEVLKAGPGLAELIRMAQTSENVFFHSGTWSLQKLRQFYGRMHCLVAPSRGEGKNLVALEFLSTGGTVIASDIGGHAMWLEDVLAYPLLCGRSPATWPIATAAAHEGSPDAEHLEELMWQVYCNPDAAAKKGEVGANLIPQQCDWKTAWSNLISELGRTGIIDVW